MSLRLGPSASQVQNPDLEMTVKDLTKQLLAAQAKLEEKARQEQQQQPLSNPEEEPAKHENAKAKKKGVKRRAKQQVRLVG